MTDKRQKDSHHEDEMAHAPNKRNWAQRDGKNAVTIKQADCFKVKNHARPVHELRLETGHTTKKQFSKGKNNSGNQRNTCERPRTFGYRLPVVTHTTNIIALSLIASNFPKYSHQTTISRCCWRQVHNTQFPKRRPSNRLITPEEETPCSLCLL